MADSDGDGQDDILDEQEDVLDQQEDVLEEQEESPTNPYYSFYNTDAGSALAQLYGGAGATGLPTDPEAAYAAITRGEYLDYISDYRDFEEGLIAKAQSDTSLIDQAREDIGTAQDLTKGIAERNLSRYGAVLTPAQQREQIRQLQRANTLGGAQALNDARIAQKEANTALLSDLINIGQGVNRASQSQLGSAAADATSRQNAYMQAKAAQKSQTYQTVGALASMAIIAYMF